MLKKLSLPIFLVSFFIFVPFVFYVFSSQSQSMPTDKKEVYELPYPGILPDHPLYFIKNLRDKTLDLTTRDSIKKAELYLLFSDKKLNMGIFLAKKGSKKVVETLLDAEETFSKIPQLLKNSKKQGVAPRAEFIEKLKLSNKKHEEVIKAILKNSKEKDQILEINQQNKKALSLL